MKIIKKIKTFFKLYGWRFALLKILKAAIYRLTSFRWEKCYLMTRVLDKEIPIEVNDEIIIREVKIDDFDDRWREDYVDNSRLNAYKVRINRDDAIVVGAFIDGKLAYSTWILFDGIEVGGTIYKKDGYGMLWDSYCLPQYRGRGLHNMMNAYSLNLMKSRGMSNGCVLILSHNIPAYKTQIRCGMEKEKVFYTYYFLRRKYSTFKF